MLLRLRGRDLRSLASAQAGHLGADKGSIRPAAAAKVPEDRNLGRPCQVSSETIVQAALHLVEGRGTAGEVETGPHGRRVL